jgi:hypothetical protein
MEVILINRDKYCNYCKNSSHKEEGTHLSYYIIRGEIGTTVISICEKCARELYQLLGETVKPE